MCNPLVSLFFIVVNYAAAESGPISYIDGVNHYKYRVFLYVYFFCDLVIALGNIELWCLTLNKKNSLL